MGVLARRKFREDLVSFMPVQMSSSLLVSFSERAQGWWEPENQLGPFKYHLDGCTPYSVATLELRKLTTCLLQPRQPPPLATQEGLNPPAGGRLRVPTATLDSSLPPVHEFCHGAGETRSC
jgi:hypothetical protein